ncbi:MAG TPA: DUF4062 domain-containing protein [Pseudomonadales bacterium]|nr:DUF4062 domain-containing protein [Pseudomonadales bacterium]
MAKPRIFVSSTFYDLRSVRDDLDRFIRSMGYEPVRHERGNISYGNDEKPEAYAYREIESCEVLVCIIGGKYGTTSSDSFYSITQKELKTAVDLGKQIYVFVEDGVFHEHRYYLANKGLSGVRYTAVDNEKVHAFLEEVYALPKGNPVFSFSVSSDITSMLNEQWAGLFHRLLNESSSKSQTALIEELQRSLQTVGQLVKFLSDEKGKGQAAIEEILFANHPLFVALKDVLKNTYRIYFTSIGELDDWLSTAKLYTKVDKELEDYSEYFEWERVLEMRHATERRTVYIAKTLFTEKGDLIAMSPANWDNSLVRFDIRPLQKSKDLSVFDDDIPF